MSQQIDVNGDVVVAQLMAMRASALSVQQQCEAMLAMFGVGPNREQVAQTASDVLGGSVTAPVFGAPQEGRVKTTSP